MKARIRQSPKLTASRSGDWRGGKWAWNVCYPDTGNIITYGATAQQARKIARELCDAGWKYPSGLRRV